MIAKILKVGACFNVQEILSCFHQLKYFTNTFLTFSGNKRFTISSFVNPFQSSVVVHTKTSLDSESNDWFLYRMQNWSEVD